MFEVLTDTGYQRYSSVMMTEAAGSSETSVHFYQTQQNRNPENSSPHLLTDLLRDVELFSTM
jgi:hypothetical protein